MTYIFKVLLDGAHTPLEMVQTKVLVPVIKLLTLELFSVGVVTLDPPAITVHSPVPTTGELPVKVEVDVHKFCEGPTVDIVGISSTYNVTLETEARHGALEIVHSKIFVPKPKPVIVVFGEVGLVIVPLPETKVHNPVPTVGVLAVMVVVGEDIQSV